MDAEGALSKEDEELLLTLIFRHGGFTWRHVPELALVSRRWKQLAGRGGAADLLAGLALSFGGVSYDRSPIGHGVSGDVIGDSAGQLPRVIRALENVRVVSVSAGWQHSLFLDSEGRVYSCGAGGVGRLGHGNEQNLTVPKQIRALDGVFITHIVAGAWHNLVLSNRNQVYSFGYGEPGALGLGDIENRLIPTPIPAFNGVRIKQLAAGSVHSLAVTHEGQVYAFGSNRDGQMGFDLLMSSVIMVPQLVRSLESLFITAVSAGDHHSLFLSDQGRVYSCGWSRYGVLGYTIDGQQALPKMIDALASTKIVGISAGEFHSLAVCAEGGLYSFGCRDNGKLGLGIDDRGVSLPNKVTTLNNEKVVAVAAGAQHSIVITDDGKVFSFGIGNNNRLGHGDAHKRLVPTRVQALAGLRVVAVAVNGRHSLALT